MVKTLSRLFLDLFGCINDYYCLLVLLLSKFLGFASCYALKGKRQSKAAHFHISEQLSRPAFSVHVSFYERFRAMVMCWHNLAFMTMSNSAGIT